MVVTNTCSKLSMQRQQHQSWAEARVQYVLGSANVTVAINKPDGAVVHSWPSQHTLTPVLFCSGVLKWPSSTSMLMADRGRCCWHYNRYSCCSTAFIVPWSRMAVTPPCMALLQSWLGTSRHRRLAAGQRCSDPAKSAAETFRSLWLRWPRRSGWRTLGR